MKKNSRFSIPPLFNNFDGDPFKHCIMCNMELISNDIPYMIERAFKPGDIVFEYAICHPCALKMRSSMSKESVKSIDGFMSGYMDKIFAKAQSFQDEDEFILDDFVGQCLVTDKFIHQTDRYQIVGYFSRQQFDKIMPPFMLSEEAAEQIQSLISKKTKDELDDFIDEFLGLPPELKELFKDSDILVFH